MSEHAFVVSSDEVEAVEAPAVAVHTVEANKPSRVRSASKRAPGRPQFITFFS